jgi:hypothetical protein
MNNVFFPLASESLFNRLQKMIPDERFIVPPPGRQITTDSDRFAGSRVAPRA